MTSGPASGHIVELEPLLDEYYRLMGWDEHGTPTPEKVEALGLSESA
jgi:aldehyde:ferredoxin oxidoreductase